MQSAEVRQPTHVLSTQNGFWVEPDAVQSGSSSHWTHLCDATETSHSGKFSVVQSPESQHALQTFPQQTGVSP